MIPRWQTVVGITLGLGIGFALHAMLEHPANRGSTVNGPILSECDGHLSELVIHYDPAARNLSGPVYREFLGALEADITVHAVCPNRGAFEELTNVVGTVACRVDPILVDHPITTWSRDRWIALGPANDQGPVTLWSPRGEAADEIWPARAGDERVGDDIAAALYPAVRSRRSGLYFDGGDLLADGRNVFVVPRVLSRNIQHTVADRKEFLRQLSDTLERHVILLEDAPDHHAGMFMTAVGNNTMLVGDPRLGQPFAKPNWDLPGGPDFTPETQARFDAIANQCMAAGYRVIRIPTVPARDGRTYYTYCNVLIDAQSGRRVVYLPTYRGTESMTAAARAVWEGLGYEVVPIDCTSVYRHFGCLHCLVNVLHRSDGPTGHSRG
jgi:N-dimethylarginine dimethylaminohydrolase